MARAAQTKDIDSQRQDYKDRLRKLGISPLWDQYRDLLSIEPQITSVPHIWKYDELRGILMESGDLISAQEAQRRVLMLENPAFQDQCKATETLFTGLQLILPGEIAPAHRHTPNALRLILEGDGAYTSVNGEKTVMHYGDYIITPNWCWHDHGHEGTEPVVWQDILDLPLLKSIGTIFYESYPDEQFPEGPPPGDSLHRYGSNMLPVGLQPDNLNSPIFCYPYEKSRETMEALSANSELDPYHGIKMEFIDPTTGGPAMSSISTFLIRMPQGFKTERYQTTEGAIFTCLEGKGRVVIGSGDAEQIIEFSPRDIFVVPCWYPHRFEVDENTYIFEGTDKVVQSKLGLWRERRGNT
ncbi:MAG: cupin domain-containing protein [Rhodospirillales bacterium]|nr:cupin domain-containing protein [Rhodospirillales bacterium]